jgi:hypothetical protein
VGFGLCTPRAKIEAEGREKDNKIQGYRDAAISDPVVGYKISAHPAHQNRIYI